MRTKRDSSRYLLKSLLKIKSVDIIQVLSCSQLYISTWLKCHKATQTNVTYECILNSNHIESDTKIDLHCSYAVEERRGGGGGRHVLVRSPSGDVNILDVLLLLLSNQDAIIIDFGNGNNRKASFL